MHGNPLAGDNAALAAFQPSADVFRLQPWRAGLALLADWSLIALAFALAMYAAHPVAYGVAAILIARSQLALSVVMHEGAHGLLARRRGLNDGVAQLLAAGPLWLSLRSYRSSHLKHHRAPMDAQDPVAQVFGMGRVPRQPLRLGLWLLAYACGVGYAMTVFKMLRGDFRAAMPKTAKSPAYVAWELVSMLASNGLVLALLVLAGQPWLYVGLWLLPSVTLLPLLGQMRAIFEHGGMPPSTDQSRNARSMVAPTWQSFLCGPHAVHFHIEHHLYVRVPFYHLASVHQQLAQQQLLPTHHLYTGYGQVLRDITRSTEQARPGPPSQ